MTGGTLDPVAARSLPDSDGLPTRLPDQPERLAALRAYGILDTPAEPAFDDITRIAALVCDVPIAVVNFVDEKRQWFKSEIGLGMKETPLDVSFCAHAILQDDFMEVPDASVDPRFCRNPLVTATQGLRFYAGALLRTPAGHAIGTICVLDNKPRQLDVAQRRTLRALARQTMAQLELRRALADVARGYRYRGRLMAIAGHDLKQPLTMMTMALDILGSKLEQPSDLRQLDLARKAAERLNRDLTDLARASRLDDEADAVTMERVPIDELLAGIVDTWMHVAARKHLQLELRAPGALMIRTHRGMLRTICDNLIGNAIKYTTQGSVTVRCHDDAARVWIDVADTGKGIPAEQREQIFQAFHQLDPDSDGLGLGLSIVKNTADTLGCVVKVDCGDSGGTTFSVGLPKQDSAGA